jgi:hypothetical protein
METIFLLAQNSDNSLHKLDGLIGNWDVVVERRLSPPGQWDTSNATSMFKKTTGGVVIEEDFDGNLQGKPFSTKTIIVFNHFTNKSQRTFIDSEHGVLVDYDGEEKGDTTFFDKNWIYPNNTTVKLRVIYTIISSKDFLVKSMRMPENTLKWDLTDRMRYIKRK